MDLLKPSPGQKNPGKTRRRAFLVNPFSRVLPKRPIFYYSNSQGWIFAVWILATKLPNSDLNFAVDFLVDFFLLFFQGKRPAKNPPKNPPQNSPRTLFGKIPLGFLQKPFLDKFSALLRAGGFLNDFQASLGRNAERELGRTRRGRGIVPCIIGQPFD